MPVKSQNDWISCVSAEAYLTGHLAKMHGDFCAQLLQKEKKRFKGVFCLVLEFVAFLLLSVDLSVVFPPLFLFDYLLMYLFIYIFACDFFLLIDYRFIYSLAHLFLFMYLLFLLFYLFICDILLERDTLKSFFLS